MQCVSTNQLIVMDEDFRDSLINFAVGELANAPSNHVIRYIKSELGSSRHHLFSALLAAKEESDRKNEKLKKKVKTTTYADLVASSAEDHKNNFRMNRKTIKFLVSLLRRRLATSPEGVHPLIPVEKKVLLTTWLLGNKQSFMAAARMFELSKGTVYRVFHQICKELTKLAGKYIRWPNPEECEEISAAFERRYGFPGVIGVLNTCHVEIREPESREEADKFLNTETSQYTVLLQVVVDHEMRFRDVSAGFPGQIPKSKVLSCSPLFAKLISQADPLVEPSQHILGGSDYPQLSTLLTPYTGDDLSPQEQKYNELHQEICDDMQQVFTKLKERFQRLNFIDVSRTELASKVMVAACILHNIALLHKDT